jgi:hypothetical protein
MGIAPVAKAQIASNTQQLSAMLKKLEARVKPAHRWSYFSEMQPDEAVLIRTRDSATDGRARLSFDTPLRIR